LFNSKNQTRISLIQISLTTYIKILFVNGMQVSSDMF